ncbi:hypothetical protein [Streptomyces rochei]|uniref:hypothetical protein n=1 Tax=Streptomyces rochei TaxID=1928 RepID=UPI0013B74E4F|nr:hypothetical protein [Streptomyces rochei]NEC70967.1 hypothetical protein [Streptomyces rochei]
MRHILLTAVTVTAVVTVTVSCSSKKDSEPAGGGTSASAGASATASASTATSASSGTAVTLSTTWIPKMDEATTSQTEGVCARVSTQTCADHLAKIVLAGIDLQGAITEAGAERMYPRSGDELDKMMRASNSYVDEECLNDPTADLDGSQCFTYALDIMGAGASLQLTMTTDELKWQLGG